LKVAEAPKTLGWHLNDKVSYGLGKEKWELARALGFEVRNVNNYVNIQYSIKMQLLPIQPILK
jgi:hypothetical protein